MFIAVLKIRHIQGSVFFALGHVFSPPPTRLDLTMQKLLFPTLRDDLPESLWRNNPHCRCQTISLPNNNGYPAIFFWQSCRDLLFFAKSGLLMRLGTIFYCTRRSVNAATSVRRRARLRAVERAARRRAARFGWRQFEWRQFERGSRRGWADVDPQRSMRRRLPHGCLG